MKRVSVLPDESVGGKAALRGLDDAHRQSLPRLGPGRSRSAASVKPTRFSFRPSQVSQTSLSFPDWIRTRRSDALFDPRPAEARRLSEEAEKNVTIMRGKLKIRLQFIGVIVAIVLVLLLLAAFTSEESCGREHVAPLAIFAATGEACVLGLALVAYYALRFESQRFAIAVRVVLIWGFCTLLSVGSPSRRCRLLGLKGQADMSSDAFQEPCEEGAVALWLAVLLGLVAVFQQLPFIIYAPLSQLLCLQYLMLSIIFPRPECNYSNVFGPGGPLLGLSPTYVSALQLHILTAQFSLVCWRNTGEERLAPLVEDFIGRKTQASLNLGVNDGLVKNWMEILVEDMRSVEVDARQLVLNMLEVAPSTKMTLAWVSSLNMMTAFVSRIAAQLQARSSALKANGAGLALLGCQRASVNSAPGRVNRSSGIQGFIQQSFMNEVEDTACSETREPRKSECNTIHELAPQAWSPHEDEEQPQEASDESPRSAKSPFPCTQDFDIGKWQFDALEVNRVHGQCVQLVGYEFLSRPRHALKRDALLTFLSRLEEGYVADNPYHTQVHAADVCNNMVYMMKVTSLWNSSLFSDAKRTAVVLAGLGHDFGHFGKNSHFLIVTKHELATTYNDRSVLENFHVAALFRLLDNDRGDERHPAGAGLLADFKRESYTTARQLIISLILATDTQHHLEAIREFGLRLDMCGAENSIAESFDPVNNTKDLNDAMCVMFRAADIGHSAKSWPVHVEWSTRVSEEFHRQGDAERRLGLPISPLCNRDGFVLSSSQTGFLQFVCLPTWVVIARFESMLKLDDAEDFTRVDPPSKVSVSRLSTSSSIAPVSRGGSRRDGGRMSETGFSWKMFPPVASKSMLSEDLQRRSTPNTTAPETLASVCSMQCELNLQEWKRLEEEAREKEKPQATESVESQHSEPAVASTAGE
mmetsp:Transcript_76009/g.211158  ORF Transcript_76009/g.211158 Transcript_76009/m.211158 type:complete len:925 (+) Transcript_76009:139-2913(+)